MNAIDICHYGHEWVHKHLRGFSDSDWIMPDVCGWWSTKEIIAHLASFELLLTEVLASQNDKLPTPTLESHHSMNGDAFNTFQVGKRSSLTVHDTLAEYDQHFTKVASLLVSLPAEVLRTPGSIPWYGKEYALDDFIVYQYYGHKREHMAQVAILRDKLKK